MTSITGTREPNNTQQTSVSQHQGRLNHRNQGVYQHTTDISITASRATQSQEPGSLTTHNRHQYHSIKGDSITGTRESNNRHQYHSIKGDVNHRNQGVYQHTTDTSITASRATSITGTRESNNRHQYHSIKGDVNHRNQGVYQHTTDTSITASITGTREPTNTQQTPVSQHQSQEPGSLPTHNRHQYHSIKVDSITGTRESTNTQQTPVSQHQGQLQSQEPGSLPTHNRHQYHSIKGNFNHRNQGV